MARLQRFGVCLFLVSMLLVAQASAAVRFVVPDAKGVPGYGVVLPVYLEGDEVISFSLDLVFNSQFFSADPALLATHVNYFANQSLIHPNFPEFGPHYALSYETLSDRIRVVVSPAPGTVVPETLSLDDYNRMPKETSILTEVRIKPGLVMFIPLTIKPEAAGMLGQHALTIENVVVGGSSKNSLTLGAHSIGAIDVEADEDGDGISNNFESGANGTTTSISATADLDNDNLTNFEEYLLGTNPLLADSDSDTCNDDVDAHPNDDTECYDFDNDGIGDNKDPDDDNDGLSDLLEASLNNLCQDPSVPCFDVNNALDPWLDFDGDGLINIVELKVGTQVYNQDSDYDSVYDSIDVFPLDFSEYADSNWDGIGDNAAADGTNNGLPITSWVKSFKMISGWADTTGGHSINDVSDSIIVSGGFNGEIEFEPSPVSGLEIRRSVDSVSAFITRLDSLGGFQWTRILTAPEGDPNSEITINTITSDQHSNIYVAGNYSGTIHFPSNEVVADDVVMTSDLGSSDIFIAKYNRFGELIWVKGYGGSAADRALDLAVDHDFNVYFSGIIRGAAVFESSTLNSAGGADAVIGKLDYQGGLQWVTREGDAGENFGNAVSVHEHGFAYLGTTEELIQLNALNGSVNWRSTQAGGVVDLDVFVNGDVAYVSGYCLCPQGLRPNPGDVAYATGSSFVGRLKATTGQTLWEYSSNPVDGVLFLGPSASLSEYWPPPFETTAGQILWTYPSNSADGDIIDWPPLLATYEEPIYNRYGNRVAVELVSIDVDRDDLISVTGYYENGIADPFDDANTLVGGMIPDKKAAMVIRYTGDGVPEWYRTKDSLEDDYAASAYTLADGGYAVSGFTGGDLKFVPEVTPVTSGASFYVAKFKRLSLEKSPTPFELKRRFGLGNMLVKDLAVDDSNGNISVAGFTSDYDSNVPVPVEKYNNQGQLLWRWSVLVHPDIADNVLMHAYQLTSDNQENVYVAGLIGMGPRKYAFDFDNDGVYEAGNAYGEPIGEAIYHDGNYFVTKLDSTGAHVWTYMRPMANGYTQFGELLADNNGGVHVLVRDLEPKWCVFKDGVESCGVYSAEHFCATDRLFHLNSLGACQSGHGVLSAYNINREPPIENDRLYYDANSNPVYPDFSGAALRSDGKLVTTSSYPGRPYWAGIEIHDPVTHALETDKTFEANIFHNVAPYRLEAFMMDTDSAGNTYRMGQQNGSGWDFDGDDYIDVRPNFIWWSLQTHESLWPDARQNPELVIHQYSIEGEYMGFAAFDNITFPATNSAFASGALDIDVLDDIYVASGQFINVLTAKGNHPPEALSMGFYTDEDVVFQDQLVGQDPNADDLAYTIISQPRLGSIALDASTGQFTYTPYENESGVDLFSYQVSDNEYESNIATVSVAITSVNDAPTMDSKVYYTSVNRELLGRIEAHDIEREALEYSIDTNGLLGTLTLTNTATGEFSYMPAVDSVGVDTLVIRVTDPYLASVTATLTINISLDTDGDGISDELDSDDDNDGLNDSWEISFLLNPLNADSDGDGLDDGYEIRVLGTDALSTDSDGDGMPDDWEQQYSLKPLDPSDADNDPDSDGINNLIEYQIGTDPHIADSDGDGIPDGWEYQYGLNPLSIVDGTEDPDFDGLDNLAEYQNGTDPFNADSDGDNVNDGDEVALGRKPTVNEAVVIQIINELLLEE